MRELTQDEMHLVGGGDDATVVVIDLLTYVNDGIPAGTPVGTNPHSPNSPPSNHATINPPPNIRIWNSKIMSQLSQAQKNEVDAIGTYGLQHGFSESQINSVIDEAYYETSLGINENNDGVHFGLFQYDTTTWNQNGYGNLNINSDADQITAMFTDLNNYETRYATGQASNQIPSTLSFEDYFEIKHHLGNNSLDFSDARGAAIINDYNTKAATLGITWQN